MIIGNNKDEVIVNIEAAVENQDFNRKVEVNDPNLNMEEKHLLLKKYLAYRDTIRYRHKCDIARSLVDVVGWWQNMRTKIVGMENLKRIKGGAIVTSNHFNPLDNTIIRGMTQKTGRSRLYVVCQDTNLAMKGIVGFAMNYADVIPISSNKEYMNKYFPGIIHEKLIRNQFILIYPEQEMWFNYRKPRPLKRGAYYYAALFNVPVISCFVEMIDRNKKENDDFYKVDYILHILEPIYPDLSLNPRDNSLRMMKKDYEQKVAAYEKVYGKKLDYKFENNDIAGWILA